MRAICVDTENELSDIAAEVDQLGQSLTRLRLTAPVRGSHDAWEAVHICASATEKIYTGLERVMARLASEVDEAPVGRADGWHLALLKRVANPVPNVRTAIVSADCYARLDRLRAFRHRERNTYGLDLDFDIVLARSAEAIAAFALFRQEVRTFLAGLASE